MFKKLSSITSGEDLLKRRIELLFHISLKSMNNNFGT